MAMKKIAIPTLGQWQGRHHEITKEDHVYRIGLDDQAVWNKADAKVAKKHKRGDEESGHNVLRKEFLSGLNTELTSGLKEIVKDEKLGLQDQRINYIGTFFSLLQQMQYLHLLTYLHAKHQT